MCKPQTQTCADLLRGDRTPLSVGSVTYQLPIINMKITPSFLSMVSCSFLSSFSGSRRVTQSRMPERTAAAYVKAVRFRHLPRSSLSPVLQYQPTISCLGVTGVVQEQLCSRELPRQLKGGRKNSNLQAKGTGSHWKMTAKKKATVCRDV